jgi:hypothetical protein
MKRALGVTGVLLVLSGAAVHPETGIPDDAEYRERIRPVLTAFCLECHSTKAKKGDLDLERFTTLAEIRKDLRPWLLVIENLENGEMPPKKAKQPGREERQKLARWVRGVVDLEARARAGDPGRVVVRRLSNAEYNNTVRDLTGVDLEPARDFPADGAAGEGFTNAGDALVTSPTLLAKYLAAAKEIAAHAVLLPDGVRFSPSKTQRDWTDESLAALRSFFSRFTPDGRLPLKSYLAAALRHDPGTLNRTYYTLLLERLEKGSPSVPLDRTRARWKTATAKDVEAIAQEIAAWQAALFKMNKIGSYGGGKVLREEANDPPIGLVQSLKIQPRGTKGDVVLHLSVQDLVGGAGPVVWERPRFVSGAKPALLLKDYRQFGTRYEVDLRALFSSTADYLAAAVDRDPKRLDADWLRRWTEILDLESKGGGVADLDRMPPVSPVDLLDVPTPKNDKWPAIRGWRGKGGDLPVVLSNASDRQEQIPGRASPHKVVVHPSPDKYVAAAWECPADGKVTIGAKISHAHPGCGNGIAWWLEIRRKEHGAFLAEGTVDPGQTATPAKRELRLTKGDRILLAVDPRDGNHVCDLTEINLSLEAPGASWDLARDVADAILEGNPHGAWSFVEGPAQKGGKSSSFKIPGDSALGKWRAAALDPARRGELPALAQAVQALLTGERPTKEKSPDQVLYDSVTWVDGPLLVGLDLTTIAKAPPLPSGYGLDPSRFDGSDLRAESSQTLDLRLPAGIFRDYEFAVEGRLLGGEDRIVQFRILTGPAASDPAIDGKAPLVGNPAGDSAKALLRGFQEFRDLFPQYLCFPRIIPDDEAVCLKLYHREDQALRRLFLTPEEARRLDALWEEHRFITQWPLTEHQNLPQFIGFTTQDAPKEVQVYFESLREPFRKRAEEFQKEVERCEPAQVEAVLRFAARAYRRTLSAAEADGYRRLYAELRAKPMSHPETLRALLARILVAPSFLFKLEETPVGGEARPVSDVELATRLSYFLWATMPDAELSTLATEGKLHEPAVLSAQVDRMLRDPKIRGVAMEFATQWIHIRDLRQNREKNEKLFPTFDNALRDALFEEAVHFFEYLFREGRPVRELLDADYVFVNELLARHYGIPGVKGAEWRRVDRVRAYGRGGLLALGSVLAKESGASRTSPVLRGNWLVETMLGEKLPKPPANVPRLPEEEQGAEGTVREMVARHTRVAECAVCHVRIDPFGFALEKYDPIGRYREKDLAGHGIDVAVRLKDGTEFEGLEGLRRYLLGSRWKDLQRTFVVKLLGYALGRSTTLSDQPLLEELQKQDGLADVVQRVVSSKQFRYHRASEETKEE